MKNFFEDVTREVVPRVKQTFEKGQKFFMRLLSKVDFDLSKTIQIMREKQEQLKQYVINREKLIREIDRKEFEVNRLREQIHELRNEANTRQLDDLRQELNYKLDDLLKSQRKYYDLEVKIEEEQKKVNELLQDKQKLEQERNLLKSKYDQIKHNLNENKNKTKLLEQELEELKEKEKHYESLLNNTASKEEIRHYEKLLAEMQTEQRTKLLEQEQLKSENEKYKQEHNELEQLLIQKISDLSKTSKELNETRSAMDLIQKEKEQLKSQLLLKEKNLNESNARLIQLEKKVSQLKQLEIEYEAKYTNALQEAKRAQTLLFEYQEDFANDMISYEERLKNLQNELLDKQNEISIIKAEHAEPGGLSHEEQHILEREFEPRFQILYKNCIFTPEFLSDFFYVTPSDRLKIEAAIVQLNYNYDQALSNIQRNSIKTKKKTILEYPFSTDSAGRIYFNKQNHIVHLYRLSRTKNGRGKLTQANVIAWLEKNV